MRLNIEEGRVERDLNTLGWHRAKKAVTPALCQDLIALYAREDLFRSRVHMARHGFGAGEYQYFADPLVKPLGLWRAQLYETLRPIAQNWRAMLGEAGEYPRTHEDYLALCANAGQLRPTPLMLKYGPGDYNCLHQDLYGEHVFPIQAALMLSQKGEDYDGGETVLTEQRPRMQSRPHVLTPDQGDLLIFPVRHRPHKGARGYYRVNVRHGVSQLTRGARYVLGLILHNAQ
ncbi:2OG-Fe(II) oxygenase [Woodsholea maritima]|uniref:2OG-Fe(II) oxygenase n=1 Tax=Woodsholea maritima TaxID=240237 RepID=UPI000360FFF7|nr:2OG-Fe(II) oxygenase [Woodsholea maritima]